MRFFTLTTQCDSKPFIRNTFFRASRLVDWESRLSPIECTKDACRADCRSKRVGFIDEFFWPSPYCTNLDVAANGNNVAASIVAQQSSISSPSSGENKNTCQKHLKHGQQLVEEVTRIRDGFEACVQLCNQVTLVSGPKRCFASESKQLETCTDHRWQHLNMFEVSESPTTSTTQQSNHMFCTSNFTRVSSSVVCCGSLCFLGVLLDGKQVKRKRNRSMIMLDKVSLND